MIKKILRKILVLTVLLCSAPEVFATYTVPDEYQPSNIAEPWTESQSNYGGDDYGAYTVTLILGDMVSGVLALVGVLAVYFLVSNALKYVSSFGQQDKLDQAKKGIFWAIGGLLVIILSYTIVRFVIRVVVTVDAPYV